MDHAAAGCATDLQRLDVATKICRASECRLAFQTTLQHQLRRAGNVKAWTARQNRLQYRRACLFYCSNILWRSLVPDRLPMRLPLRFGHQTHFL